MKTALVTGGSRGIGSAIALGLGKNFHVVVGYANSKTKPMMLYKKSLLLVEVQVQFKSIYQMLNL